MSVEVLRAIASEVAEQLVRGDFDRVVARCETSRLSSEDLASVIADYGKTLMPAPREAYDALDAVRVKGAAMPTWSVRIPLWTREEGRSDLTVELTIVLGEGTPRIELDDLHVL
jgi:hypothetical protein